MRILLTNDDGIRAPGIVALYEALVGNPPALPPFGVDAAGAGEPARVFTVAPLTVQSATGHGVTFHTPLMVTDVDVPTTRPGLTMRGVAVDGRPADCVKLAVSSIWPERVGAEDSRANGAARDPLAHNPHARDPHARDPDSASGGRRSRPDLLISGMNAGANCGINVIYSGTVAAALEGAFLGIPSIAVSMMLGRGRPRFDVGALRARRVLDLILRRGLPKPYEVISINIPVCEEPAGASASPERTPAEQFPMPPVRVCGMNTHGLVDAYERRVAPSGEVYYWAAGHGLDFHATEPESDVDLLKQGCITVTPLKYDLTKHEMLKVWRERVEGT